MPLYLLIGLGMVLRSLAFPSTSFWAEVEKLTYYILFPALIFSSLSRAEISTELMQLILLIIALPTMFVGALQGLGLIRQTVSGPTMTSMFQGAVRNNTTLGLVIIALIMPDGGIALMALTMTSMIIINNLISVWMLERYAHQASPPSLQKTTKNMISNPLILASIAGLVVNLSPLSLPGALLDTIKYLGNTGLPLALLAIGAGLKLKTVSGKLIAIGLPSLSKLVLLPLVTWFLCRYLQVSTELSKVFILYAAMPTAMSSYVLASQMGGDKETMAQIITFQMLTATLTLPIIISVIQSL